MNLQISSRTNEVVMIMIERKRELFPSKFITVEMAQEKADTFFSGNIIVVSNSNGTYSVQSAWKLLPMGCLTVSRREGRNWINVK